MSWHTTLCLATFDPNQYKDDITRYVKENRQRTLVIPGTLSLSFFPKVGVQVGELSLSEFNSDLVFARLAGAKVSVELLPLLSRQVVVDRVQVDGLTASFVKGKNGKFNFDDLVAPGAAPAGKPGAGSGTQDFKLDIDSVKVGGAALSCKNEKTDFSELSLSAAIANGVATSNDLNMASPLLRAKGAGKVDIGANTLDYTIRPKLVATPKGQEGKTYERLSGIEMPVKIYGALDAPQYQPDYAAAALSAARSEIGGKLLEKAAGGKAGGLLGNLLGKESAKPAAPGGAAPAQAPADEKKNKAKDLLKGLFN